MQGFDPWIRKICWRRVWQPTPVFWPGESQGQRSLVGYSLWGHKELDMTEQLSMHYVSVESNHLLAGRLPESHLRQTFLVGY